MTAIRVSAAAAATLCLSSFVQGQQPSESALWGANGEKWTSASRIPDFSKAGYRCGEEELPSPPIAVNVKDYGAKGDGESDDSAAFAKAIKALPEGGGAVLVPAGRYVLGDVVEIRKSRTVLRGEGPGKTVLRIPKPLSEIHPKGNVDETKTFYAFSGGFIAFKGDDKGQKLCEVSAAAKRGDAKLQVSDASKIKPGSWVRLVMSNPADNSLLRCLHANQKDPGPDTVKSFKKPVDWAAKAVSVEGSLVLLDRPLRVDVSLDWKPELLSMEPSLTQSGVENLSFVFSGEPKKPHLQEAGYNAIHMVGAQDCWVRNVEFTDADNGVIVGRSRFCLVDGVKFKEDKRKGITGHHALWATGLTQDSLFTNFEFSTRYVHDLTVEGFANGNVFTKGSGPEMDFDHHSNGPYENLFCEIDVGNPDRLWSCGGRQDRGPHSGMLELFWNIKGHGKFAKAPLDWPLITMVGVGEYPETKNPDGAWVEPCGGAPVPANIFEAQRKLRK